MKVNANEAAIEANQSTKPAMNNGARWIFTSYN